jgi:hypothetical protein
MKIRQSAFLLGLLTPLTLSAQDGETTPKSLQRIVAVENVCAWPNLTSMPDGTIIAVIHNQPAHGLLEGDVDCYASTDGAKWEKRSTVTAHEPNTVRMNHAAGLAKNGDLLVLCSGWTDLKQPQRPKQAKFRDDILRPWVMRSSDAGRTWSKHADFPAAETGWSEQIPFGDIWVGADGARGRPAPARDGGDWTTSARCSRRTACQHRTRRRSRRCAARRRRGRARDPRSRAGTGEASGRSHACGERAVLRAVTEERSPCSAYGAIGQWP